MLEILAILFLFGITVYMVVLSFRTRSEFRRAVILRDQRLRLAKLSFDINNVEDETIEPENLLNAQSFINTLANSAFDNEFMLSVAQRVLENSRSGNLKSKEGIVEHYLGSFGHYSSQALEAAETYGCIMILLDKLGLERSKATFTKPAPFDIANVVVKQIRDVPNHGGPNGGSGLNGGGAIPV